MLPLAKQRLSDLEQLRFVQGDALSLPFHDDAFGAVFVATVLGEVPEPSKGIHEIQRFLRPNGIAHFAETRRGADFLSQSKLDSTIVGTGMELVKRSGWFWQYIANYRSN
jgi:ubiquinone/menaquinone biosynthesis C-methylase UbiE